MDDILVGDTVRFLEDFGLHKVGEQGVVVRFYGDPPDALVNFNDGLQNEVIPCEKLERVVEE